MRIAICALASALILATGCRDTYSNNGGDKTPSDSKATLSDIPGFGRLALAQPVSAGKVQVVPVVTKGDTKPISDYISLTEAKKNGWVEIIEIPGAEEVERLQVRNTGPKPLLLLGGELLLGGKQDRVVAKDTIVPPGETVEVPVFCVEPGRWSGSASFGYSEATVPLSVREAAQYEGQVSVWSKVRRYNESSAGVSSDATIQTGLSDPEVRKEIASGLAELQKSLGARNDVVGLVFIINGEIRTLELFGSPGLFAASRESLLKGLLAEAAVAEERPRKNVPIGECAQFVVDALTARRSRATVLPAQRQFELQGPIRGVETGSERYRGGAAGGGSDFVHGSYMRPAPR